MSRTFSSWSSFLTCVCVAALLGLSASVPGSARAVANGRNAGDGRMVIDTRAVAGRRHIVDGRHIVFTASADQTAVDPTGVPLLTGYRLEIFVVGGTAPVQTVNLGNPTPDSDGEIRLDFVSLLPAPLTPGVFYEAVVQAVGPGGASDSARSNPFVFSEPRCDAWISPVAIDEPATGGSAATTVNVRAGCTWTAVSDDPWIRVTGGATGSGTGTVSLLVAPNTKRNTRHGALTIAGQTLRVKHAGARTAGVSR